MSDPLREAPSPVETGWRTTSFVLRNRWLVLASAFLTATALVGGALAEGRTYTVRTSFSPQGQDIGLGTYAGLAAQLGVQLPAKAGTQPPDFYVYMLRSDALLRGLAGRRFAPRQDSRDSLPLAALLKVTSVDSALQEFAILRELKSIVQVRYDPRSQLVQMDVRTKWPGLSYQLSAALLEQVDRFNRDVLRTQAGEERRFSESRVREIAGDLKSAEDSLAAFRIRNREVRAPVLALAESRLEREVQTQQSLYVTVRQAYEQSRLQEIRNTPVISVIEAPVYPSNPDRRRLIARGVLGLLLGTALGLVIGLGRSMIGRAISEQPALAEAVGGQVSAFGRELHSPRHLWRELRREWGRGPPPEN